MDETEVNILCQQFLLSNGYTYKGICNLNRTTKLPWGQERPIGGDIPVPTIDASFQIRLDHLGDKVVNGVHERLWIEAKGGGNGTMSNILEGWCRLCFGVFYGGGDGLLAVPSDIVEKISEIEDFFKEMAHTIVGKGRVGILNVELGKYSFY